MASLRPTTPDPAPPIGVTQLDGVWLAPPPNATPNQTQTQLRVLPWRLLPGAFFDARWSGASPPRGDTGAFSDQGLAFDFSAPPPVGGVTIGAIGGTGTPAGLLFPYQNANQPFQIAITLPQASQIGSILALDFVRDGEFSNFNLPAWQGDGALLTGSSSQDAATRIWTLTPPSNSATVRTLSVQPRGALVLFQIDWETE